MTESDWLGLGSGIAGMVGDILGGLAGGSTTSTARVPPPPPPPPLVSARGPSMGGVLPLVGVGLVGYFLAKG